MVVANMHDGFGGFSRDYLTYVREECPKQPILVFGCSDPAVWTQHTTLGLETSSPPSSVGASALAKQAARDVNLALSWAAMLHEDVSSLFTPLTLQSYAEFVHRRRADDPDWIDSYFPEPRSLDHSSAYHTSAVLASALNGVTMPWRQAGDAPVPGQSDTFRSVFPASTTMSSFVQSYRMFTAVPLAQAHLSWDIPRAADVHTGSVDAIRAQLAGAPLLHVGPPAMVPLSWSCALPRKPTSGSHHEPMHGHTAFVSATLGGVPADSLSAVHQVLADTFRSLRVQHQLLASPASLLREWAPGASSVDAPPSGGAGDADETAETDGRTAEDASGAVESKASADGEATAPSLTDLARPRATAANLLFCPHLAVLEWGRAFQPCLRVVAERLQRHAWGGDSAVHSAFLEHFTRSGSLQIDDFSEAREALLSIVDMYDE